MKLPFLILCLAVVYGACLSHGDVTEIQNNEDYKVNLSDVPFERFHLRQKRNLLSPITAPLDMALRLCGLNEGAIATSVNLTKFIIKALMGQDVCPKTQISLPGLIPQMICHPVETTEALTCYFLQIVGSGSRAVTSKTFELFVQLLKNIFLPGLHTTLNALNKTGVLPPQMVALIEVFNVIYKILQLLGYVPK